LARLVSPPDFRLLLDFGCFHDELTGEQRRAEDRGSGPRRDDADDRVKATPAWAAPARREPRGHPGKRTEWKLVDDVECPWVLRDI